MTQRNATLPAFYNSNNSIGGGGSGGGSNSIGGGQKIPALGLAWSEQVNTRLLLQRHDRGDAGAGAAEEDSSNVGRTLSVTNAPHLPRASVSFYVDEVGVHGRVS